MTVNVYFQFNDNDKLVNGTYSFLKKYADPQLYLQDYNKFKDILTSKHGKPILDKEEWNEKTTPFEKADCEQTITVYIGYNECHYVRITSYITTNYRNA